MRMHGIGRLAYDASDKPSPEQNKVTSLTLSLLRADWTSLTSLAAVDKYRDPILKELDALACVKLGAEANPRDLWAYRAAGIPSVSFNTAKKKVCSKCHESTFHQTPQDISVNSLELKDSSSPKMTLPQLINNRFVMKKAERSIAQLLKCRSRGSVLPKEQ
ncbi:hypothetical protein KCU61_g4598, partial [Aureobasidium melanogenum]